MFLSFRKNKKQNIFLCKFQRNLKGSQFLGQKCADQKYLWRICDFLRTLEIHYKIFGKSNLKFRKTEKAKIKKQHDQRPVLTSVGFLSICM